MKTGNVRAFRSRLREDLKDPEFKAHYQDEREALKRAKKIAKPQPGIIKGTFGGIR
jgi:hypothetical protein